MPCPNTPFTTRLSGSAEETELRIRNISHWKRERPPVWLFASIVTLMIGCVSLVSCKIQDASAITEVDRIATGVQSGDIWFDVEESDNLVRREGVYNILLAGTDADGQHIDSMMVVSYDTLSLKVGVVSVPRDTLVDRPVDQNPKLAYGQGGVEQRAEDISLLLGVPIDYYIQIDLEGLVSVVDYVGGIDFYVPCDMDYDDPYQDLQIHFDEGMQHLNGKAVMEVARFRRNNDNSGYYDAGRTETQRKLLVTLVKQVMTWDNVTKLEEIVEWANECIDTNLPLKDMFFLASQAVGFDVDHGMETAALTGNSEVIWNGYRYCFQLDEEDTLDAVNRLLNPYTRNLTLDDMNIIAAQ